MLSAEPEPTTSVKTKEEKGLLITNKLRLAVNFLHFENGTAGQLVTFKTKTTMRFDYDDEQYNSYEEYLDDEMSTYERYQGSYAQEEGGYSDQEIDELFDGDPDMYWNID